MQLKKRFSYLLLALVLLSLITREAYAQTVPQGTARITKVDSPTTVTIGQPMTISVTAAYSVNLATMQFLAIWIDDNDLATMGGLFTTRSNSCPTTAKWGVSICYYTPPGLAFDVGNFTVTFTLTSPNSATTLKLGAKTAVMAFDSNQPHQVSKIDVQSFQITVKTS
jgi:hypothetical protein